MSTSSATQLDLAEKDNLMRCKCGFCKRTGLSKNCEMCRRIPPLRHDLRMRHLPEFRQQLLQRLLAGRVEEESRSERGEAGGVQCHCPRFRGHFRIGARGNTTAKSIGQSSHAAVGPGVEREAADKHDASWSLLAVRYRGEGRVLAPEGGRREDAQARQADGDDECRRRRFEQAQSKLLRLRTGTAL